MKEDECADSFSQNRSSCDMWFTSSLLGDHRGCRGIPSRRDDGIPRTFRSVVICSLDNVVAAESQIGSVHRLLFTEQQLVGHGHLLASFACGHAPQWDSPRCRAFSRRASLNGHLAYLPWAVRPLTGASGRQFAHAPQRRPAVRVRSFDDVVTAETQLRSVRRRLLAKQQLVGHYHLLMSTRPGWLLSRLRRR